MQRHFSYPFRKNAGAGYGRFGLFVAVVRAVDRSFVVGYGRGSVSDGPVHPGDREAGGSTSESVAVTERPSLLDTRSSEGNQLIEAKRCWTTATGYSQQSSLRVQQELWGGMLFEVAYIANLSKKQPSSILPINQIRLEMMQARPGQAQRPFPQF